MSLVALASLKGSPGVTTTVVALGAVWPADRPVLVAELDPAGGDLLARFRLPDEPGLLALAAAARHQDATRRVEECCQILPGGLPVLTAPEAAEQAAGALRTPGLVAALAGADADVLADCGRLDPGSPALEVVRRADLLLLVARPRFGELKRLAARLPLLQAERRPLGLVLVGNGDYPPGEVAATLGVEVLAALPDDPDGAAIVGGRPATQWRLRRTAVLRFVRPLATALATGLPGSAPAHRGPSHATAAGLRPSTSSLVPDSEATR